VKKLKEKLYEKFTEESDPIHDLGIGYIVFEDKYFSIYKDFENLVWQKWVKFVYQFHGKRISGIMDLYEAGKYSSTRKHCEVLVDEIIMNRDGLINVKGKGITTLTYHIIPTEKYIIKD